MRIHARRHYGQRLLAKPLSSYMSIGFNLLTRFRIQVIKRRKDRFISQDTDEKRPTYIVGDTDSTSNLLNEFRNSYGKWKRVMRSRFLAKKSAIITQVWSVFRSIAIKRRKDRFISQGPGEKRPTYIVGDMDSTSNIAESGANFADPECAQVAHKELPLKSPQGSLKSEARSSMVSKLWKFLRIKKSAAGNISALIPKGTPEPETSQVETPDSQSQEKMKNLSPEHLSILMSKGRKGMLVDDIICKAQELLQNQFEGFDGLQPPCALLVPGYSVQKKAVQIHYDSDMEHWITTCFKNGNILVADSLNNIDLSPSICEQINNIYSTVLDEPLEHVTFLDVDQQKNIYDCGLFAIANAYEFLVDGGNPSAKYQRKEMRNHLITCLQNGRFSGFPKKVRE